MQPINQNKLDKNQNKKYKIKLSKKQIFQSVFIVLSQLKIQFLLNKYVYYQQLYSNTLINKMQNIKQYHILGIAGIAFFFGVKYILDKFETSDNDQIQQQNIPSTKVAGIQNYGNTCFINSLIQALASLKSFQKNLQKIIQKNGKKTNNDINLVKQLVKVIKLINTSQGVIQIDNLLGALGEVAHQICNFEQQDSHEFYKIVINSLENAYKSQLYSIDLSNSTQQKEIFENCLLGYTQSYLECLNCKNKLKIKLEVFYDLSLQINSPYINTLQKALESFQKSQYLTDVNCVYCTLNKYINKKKMLIERLQKEKNRNRQILIKNLQKLIIFLENLTVLDKQVEQLNILINQFVDNQQTELLPIIAQMNKNIEQKAILQQFFAELEYVKTKMTKTTKISKFPKILVIHFKRLVIDSWSGNVVLQRKHIQFSEQMTFDLKNNNKKIYRLTSVLSHSGNQQMGHYYTYRKQQKNIQSWYYASDKNIQRCSLQYVMKQAAYMLFYES